MLPGNRQNCGFSLVEALVAIAILMSVVSGVMLLVDQSIRSGESITDRLAASYLAADAIEYLRYSRDTYWLSDQGSFSNWLADKGLSSCSNCKVDTRPGAAGFGASGSLRYDTASSTYGYGSGSGWEDSKYTRGINTISSGPDEATFAVTVSWPTSGGGTNEVVLVDTLSAWADD